MPFDEVIDHGSESILSSPRRPIHLRIVTVRDLVQCLSRQPPRIRERQDWVAAECEPPQPTLLPIEHYERLDP
jgi:hypothetical protein